MEKKQSNEIGLLFGREGEVSLSATPPDPFDEFQSAAEVFGFTFKMAGEQGLRALLARGDGTTTKEWLMDAAAELQQAGLGRVSGIVLEIAAQTPSMVDVEAFCPYDPNDPANRANVQAWQRAEQRRRSEWGLKRQPAK